MIRSLGLATLLAVGTGLGSACADEAAKPVSTSSIHRASQVIGMTVKNMEGKDLGTVNDVVLDVGTGQIRYLALSYGGWLGLGDKLFAVPHKMFQVRRYADSEKHYLVLNVSQETLKKAPGFDQDNWPNFATDAQWGQKIDRYYAPESTTVNKPVLPNK